jgi:hypothetical protein
MPIPVSRTPILSRANPPATASLSTSIVIPPAWANLTAFERMFSGI